MLRLIHTSDWHLGATLHGASRQAEHELFFQWLMTAIDAEQIDVLVIAGDIFDRSQPANEALAQYYRALVDLSRTRLSQVIIVGGNHDSPSQLDAPRQVLAALEVTVIGGWNADDQDRHVVALRSSGGQAVAVVLAVPYVHEYALGLRTTGLSRAELAAALAERFTALYTGLCDRAEALHPGLPLLATGHLTALGSDTADAPRDIHLVGTIGGLPSAIFDPRLRYVALGHIHRPMPVASSVACYSGSPVPVAQAEAAVRRRVVLVEVAGDKVQQRSLPVPLFRDLRALVGTLPEVQTQLTALTWTEALPPYVTVEVLTEGHVPGTGQRLRERLAAAFPPGQPGPELIHWHETNTAERTADAAPTVRLADLGIEQVFVRLCQQRGEPVTDDLLGALREALDRAGEAP